MKLDIPALRLRRWAWPAGPAALRAPWTGHGRYRRGSERADLAAARGLILGLALSLMFWFFVFGAAAVWPR